MTPGDAPATAKKGNPWPRRLVRLALLLILGAAATVGAAWVCAKQTFTPLAPSLRSPEYLYRDRSTGMMCYVGEKWLGVGRYVVDMVQDVHVIQFHDVPGYWFGGRRIEEMDPPVLLNPPPPPTSSPTRETEYQLVGLPCKALWGEMSSIFPTTNGYGQVPRATLQLPTWLGGGTAAAGSTTFTGSMAVSGTFAVSSSPATTSILDNLPIGILWPGFLIDTACYAVAWALLLPLPGMARRALRRRRGLCTACAYDLHGLPTGALCPECGQRR